MITSQFGRTVYAAVDETGLLVKIGSTGSLPCAVAVRLRQLARESHIPVSLVASVRVPAYGFLVEHTIHALLAPFRIQGEWFYLHMSQAELERLVTLAAPLVTARLAQQQACLEPRQR